MGDIFSFLRSFLKNARIPVLLVFVFFFTLISKIAFSQAETVSTDPAWNAGQKNTIQICAGGTVTVHVTSSTEKQTYRIAKYPGSITVEDIAGNGGSITFTPLAFPSPGEFLYRVVDTEDGMPNPIFKVVVVEDPVAPLLKKSPDLVEINAGQDVSATLASSGSGGISCTNLFEYRTKSGSNWSQWSLYKPGKTISTSGKTGVEIKAGRSCSCNGCNVNDNIYSWTVVSKP